MYICLYNGNTTNNNHNNEHDNDNNHNNHDNHDITYDSANARAVQTPRVARL